MACDPIARLEGDAKGAGPTDSKGWDKVRQDLFADSVSKSPADFLKELNKYNTDAATNNLPKLDIVTATDTSGNTYVKDVQVETSYHSNLLNHDYLKNTDIFDGDKVQKIETLNAAALKANPSLNAGYLQAMEVASIGHNTDQFTAILNYISLKMNDPKAFATFVNTYQDVAKQAGLDQLDIHLNDDATVNYIGIPGYLENPAIAMGTYWNSSASKGGITGALNAISGVTQTILGALQTDVQTGTCS